MKRLMIIVALLGLPACAGQQFRLSGGGALTELHGELEQTLIAVPSGGEVKHTAKETASGGKMLRGRAEFNQPVESFQNTTAGLYVDVGSASDFDVSDETDTTHVSGGAIFRHYLADDGLRPFAEVRGGYRHTWLDVGGERGNGPGAELGGGIGLEYGPAFILLDYTSGWSSIDDFSSRTDEFGLMLGGKLDF